VSLPTRAERPERVPELVGVVGPIASGKSVVAQALAVRLRDAGRAVAVVDFDDVVDQVGGYVDLSPQLFMSACSAMGESASAWLGGGADVVLHGLPVEPGGFDTILERIPARRRLRVVRLHVTYEVALQRVTGDPARGLSRDPGFLRSAHDSFSTLAASLPRSEWTFDTTIASVDRVADTLCDAILER
jgi:hypothetical protein